MSKAFCLSLAAAVCAMGFQRAAADAAVITFDDVTTQPQATIPNGYAGLNWTNFGVINGTLQTNGYKNGRASGDYVAFTGGGSTATITAPSGTFDFNSAWITGAWHNNLNVTVSGFVGTTLLYSQTVVAGSAGATLFTFNYDDITRVTFTPFGGTPVYGPGTHAAIDNLTINAPIPEPAALAMLPLAGLLMLRRRRGSHRGASVSRIQLCPLVFSCSLSTSSRPSARNGRCVRPSHRVPKEVSDATASPAPRGSSPRRHAETIFTGIGRRPGIVCDGKR